MVVDPRVRRWRATGGCACARPWPRRTDGRSPPSRIAHILEEMRRRQERLEERSAKKRQLALEAMCEVGLKKLEQPDFAASARSGIPSLIVVSEGSVPEPGCLSRPSSIGRRSSPIESAGPRSQAPNLATQNLLLQ